MSKRSFVFLLLAAFVLQLVGCAHKQASDVPELLDPAGYMMDTAVVERGKIARKRYFMGKIVPDVQEVAFETGGKVDRLKVTFGDVVKKGDVLATLDLSDIEEQVEDLTAQIEYQKQTNELILQQLELEAKSSENTLNELYDAGVPWSGRKMQSLDLEGKELKLEQTKENQALDLERAEAQLETLKIKLESKELKAPCDGRIVYVDPQAEEGKEIADYETVYCVADETQLYAITDQISDTLLERADSMTCHINGKAYTLESDPYSREEILAMILSADKKTKSRFRITDIDDTVQAGDTVMISIETGTREDALRIPVNALYTDEGGNYVYIVEEGRRTRRNIQVGTKTEIMIEVTEGLEEGETVYVQE